MTVALSTTRNAESSKNSSARSRCKLSALRPVTRKRISFVLPGLTVVGRSRMAMQLQDAFAPSTRTGEDVGLLSAQPVDDPNSPASIEMD